MTLKISTKAPNFKLPSTSKGNYSLKDSIGKYVVIYFYPKDDTPGCTEQACKFRDDLHKLKALGANVVGISVDNTTSHAKFAREYNLPFPLLADKVLPLGSRSRCRYGRSANG